MRYFVHSTLSSDHQYTNWTRPSEKAMSPEVIPNPVLIKGGANMATSPDTKKGRHTPKGVMTEVTESQMEYLERCTAFKRHLKEGLVRVTTSKEDPEDIAKDMKPKDGSAPLTESSPELNKPGEGEVRKEGFLEKTMGLITGKN